MILYYPILSFFYNIIVYNPMKSYAILWNPMKSYEVIGQILLL